MNQELLEKFQKVDQVCKESTKHFTNSASLQKRAENAKENEEHKVKVITITMIVIEVIVLLFFAIKNSLLMMCIWILLSCIIDIRVFNAFNTAMSKNEDYQKFCRASKKELEAGQKILNDNANAISFLPDDYFFPRATEYLVKVVQMEQASTLGEAIDHLDEQIHRWKIENANDEILRRQQEQSEMLKNISRSSAVTASAASTVASVSVAKAVYDLFK